MKSVKKAILPILNCWYLVWSPQGRRGEAILHALQLRAHILHTNTHTQLRTTTLISKCRGRRASKDNWKRGWGMEGCNKTRLGCVFRPPSKFRKTVLCQLNVVTDNMHTHTRRAKFGRIKEKLSREGEGGGKGCFLIGEYRQFLVIWLVWLAGDGGRSIFPDYILLYGWIRYPQIWKLWAGQFFALHAEVAFSYN